MKKTIFKGVGVALVTPFSNDKIDFNALQNIIEHVIQGGVDFLIALGTTGETTSLSLEEQRAVLDFVIRINNDRLPIVAGPFGGYNTAEIVTKIKHFNFDGIDAIMACSPPYVKPNQEGIYQHYMAIAAESPLPILIYNVPGRTASNITADTTLRLAKASKKFAGVKDASDDVMQIMRIIKEQPDSFCTLSGDDFLTLPVIASGGNGVVSVIANVFPTEFCRMAHAAIAGDYETARHYNNLLLDIYPLMFIDGNPVGPKAALSILGLSKADVRLPHTVMQKQNFETLKNKIATLLASSLVS
ncbi:MAG: 4-hydroxy-tetrahydrodipicolinate synthase [Saprospiraceae bacterium]|nr:4-hydroxy-tetrahydrodipicolinate synthase [Saprospiraceae bacterium]MBP7699158.1 4-hydroxy-tetrahydrodipicolinate synthase [Saprospiraceae bacterium]